MVLVYGVIPMGNYFYSKDELHGMFLVQLNNLLDNFK